MRIRSDARHALRRQTQALSSALVARHRPARAVRGNARWLVCTFAADDRFVARCVYFCAFGSRVGSKSSSTLRAQSAQAEAGRHQEKALGRNRTFSNDAFAGARQATVKRATLGWVAAGNCTRSVFQTQATAICVGCLRVTRRPMGAKVQAMAERAVHATENGAVNQMQHERHDGGA